MSGRAYTGQVSRLSPWRGDQAHPSATTRAALAGVREVSRRVPLDRPSTAELLVRELQATVADAVYAESLAMVARLVR